jgi:ATP-binding cassette subfamily C protein
VALALLEVTRGLAILRLEGRAGAALQAALWDRLLDLPPAFFRRFTAGDLVLRAFGVDAIRTTLTASGVSALVGGSFALLNAALLVAYAPGLAAWALALVGVAVAVALAASARQLRLRQPMAAIEGELSGMVLQLLAGVARLRVAAAEQRAFARWAARFAEQRRLARRTRVVLPVWSEVYPTLATMVLYAVVAGPLHAALPPGRFIAFVAAWTALLGATLTASQSLLGMLAVAPAWERLRPILETAPEVDATRRDPGVLTGAIEVANVSFAYDRAAPPILRDVNLRIRPGEFVALVGRSGSG